MSELLNRITATWDNLSFRERILVASACSVFVVAILVLGIIQPLASMSSNLEIRTHAAEQELLAMIRLRREYDAIHTGLAGVEAQILANQQKHNLLTLLESLAAKSSVRVSSMEERKSQEDSKFKETRVEVQLQKVTLADTVSYLHAIEGLDRLLTVKSLRIKNRPDRSQLLDVTFNVSTFDPL